MCLQNEISTTIKVCMKKVYLKDSLSALKSLELSCIGNPICLTENIKFLKIHSNSFIIWIKSIHMTKTVFSDTLVPIYDVLLEQ